MSKQIAQRLAAAAEAVAMAAEQLEAERHRRNAIVVDARREGMTYAEIAKPSRITRARVIHIIAENAS